MAQSGLPHIGTFTEVLRSTMVRRAYEELTGHSTRLIAFSDDMDGLRKVPDNVPNQAMLAEHLGEPLQPIPNPFDTEEGSFASSQQRDAAALPRPIRLRLRVRLRLRDRYNSGGFDDALRNVLAPWNDNSRHHAADTAPRAAQLFSNLPVISDVKGACSRCPSSRSTPTLG